MRFNARSTPVFHQFEEAAPAGRLRSNRHALGQACGARQPRAITHLAAAGDLDASAERCAFEDHLASELKKP
jgi:hypothetical protein